MTAEASDLVIPLPFLQVVLQACARTGDHAREKDVEAFGFSSLLGPMRKRTQKQSIAAKGPMLCRHGEFASGFKRDVTTLRAGVSRVGNLGISMTKTSAYLALIATATFENDVHNAFVRYASDMLQDPRSRALFLRMAERSGIQARYSPLNILGAVGPDEQDAYLLYRQDHFPSTAERMRLFKRFAPLLMYRALDRLALSVEERSNLRHVIVTTCTGFYAPGLDIQAVEYLKLDHTVERTMIGFMGCYAAINALKQARHIVRSEPGDSVLVINLELCTLHLQESQDLGEVLSFLVFGDGCAASLVSASPAGLEMTSFQALQVKDTADLISWHIGDQGFDMVLSGQVPLSVGDALRAHRADLTHEGGVRHWAVHPGGRSVLDAVEEALLLPQAALAASREVLRNYGNMSSATVMFVLQRILQAAGPGETGCAMSFGPGLTAEMMRFVTVGN